MDLKTLSFQLLVKLHSQVKAAIESGCASYAMLEDLKIKELQIKNELKERSK